MSTTTLILIWLLIGSLTFAIACIHDYVAKTYVWLILCTILGLISLVLYITNAIDDQHINNKKSFNCVIFIICAIGFASCNSTPRRIHADIVKDQIGVVYREVNDSVVYDVNYNDYYVFRKTSHQYVQIQ